MTSEEPRFALTLITGDPLWASASCEAGVDRLLVDLERLGKASRQQGRDLFISTHDWADVEAVRAVAPPGTLMVRLDPWHAGTAEQVDRAVGCGVDFVMLPYFFSADDVFQLVDLTKGRVDVVPLVETLSAIKDLPRLLASGSISDFHLGLNDLAIDMKLMSHAALWTSDLLEEAASVARKAAIAFGIGGVTDPRHRGLDLDPAWIIGRQARLGATCGLLGRHFRTVAVPTPSTDAIAAAVSAIRRCYVDARLAA